MRKQQSEQEIMSDMLKREKGKKVANANIWENTHALVIELNVIYTQRCWLGNCEKICSRSKTVWIRPIKSFRECSSTHVKAVLRERRTHIYRTINTLSDVMCCE